MITLHARLELAARVQHAPGNAGELVGEGDGEFVGVQTLRRRHDEATGQLSCLMQEMRWHARFFKARTGQWSAWS